MASAGRSLFWECPMPRTIDRSSRALKSSSCLCLVLVLALGSSSSAGAQPPASTALDGLFLPLGAGLSAEVQGALAESVQGDDLVPAGVLRSRRVAMDFALLGERVRGLLGRPDADPVQDQAPLVLNFFDDASVEVLVDAVEPAVLGNGYVVSGSVPGQPGSVRSRGAFDGAIGLLRRLLPLLRAAFPRVRFLVRLDGGFATPELFDFLDAEPRLDYVVAMAKNAVLKRRAEPAMEVARAQSEPSGKTAHVYTDTPPSLPPAGLATPADTTPPD